MSGTVAYFPGRRAVQDDMPDEQMHRKELARATNQIMRGHLNVTLQVTLTANADSTTVIDSRSSLQTAPILVPTTAHAAAEIAAGGLYVEPSSGQVVIHHANNAQADRVFTMVLIG